nr:hypothetical protein [Opitutales bacterium]
DHIQYQTFDRDKTFTMKNNSELIKILDEALKNTRYVNEKTAKAAIENFCSEIGKISSSDSFLLSKDIEKLADLSLDPKYQILCRERAIGANDSGDSTDRCIIRLSTLDQVFAQLLRDSDNNFTIKSLYAAEQKFGKDVLDKIVRAACMNEGLKSRVSETYRNYYTTYHKDYAESHKGEDCPKLRCVDNELHKLLSKFKYLESIKPEEPKKPTKPEEPKDTNQPNYQSLRDEYKKKLQEYSKQHQEYMKKKEDYDKYQAALEEVKNQLEEYKRDKKNWEIDKKTHTWQLISGNITVMSNVEVEDSDEDPVPSIKLWNIPYFVDTKLENS